MLVWRGSTSIVVLNLSLHCFVVVTVFGRTIQKGGGGMLDLESNSLDDGISIFPCACIGVHRDSLDLDMLTCNTR